MKQKYHSSIVFIYLLKTLIIRNMIRLLSSLFNTMFYLLLVMLIFIIKANHSSSEFTICLDQKVILIVVQDENSHIPYLYQGLLKCNMLHPSLISNYFLIISLFSEYASHHHVRTPGCVWIHV